MSCGPRVARGSCIIVCVRCFPFSPKSWFDASPNVARHGCWVLTWTNMLPGKISIPLCLWQKKIWFIRAFHTIFLLHIFRNKPQFCPTLGSQCHWRRLTPSRPSRNFARRWIPNVSEGGWIPSGPSRSFGQRGGGGYTVTKFVCTSRAILDWCHG